LAQVVGERVVVVHQEQAQRPLRGGRWRRW
jgi:hypothetical protein